LEFISIPLILTRGVASLGVVGVFIPIQGVLIDLFGEGVIERRNFWVASLRAAGDIVFNRSIVDLGDGLKY
jgi:hypothetical protein